MFFDMELLCMQKGGKFAKVWIAATRGCGSLSKSEIVQIDLELLGNEIAMYITSSLSQPRNRFSLVLSSKLIFGLARLYEKKTIICFDDIVNFLTTIRKPDIRALQIFEAKTRSKPKKRIRKGLVDTTTPNIATAITQEEEITDELLQRTLNLTEAPKYLITLREPPTTVFQQPQEEELYGFGTIDDGDAVENILPEIVESSLIPEVSSSIQKTEVEVTVPPTISREEQDISSSKSEERAEEQPFASKPPEEQVESSTFAEIDVVEKDVPSEKAFGKKRFRKNNAWIYVSQLDPKSIYRKPSDDAFLMCQAPKRQKFFFKSLDLPADIDNKHTLEKFATNFINHSIENVLMDYPLNAKTRDSLVRSITSIQKLRLSEVPEESSEPTIHIFGLPLLLPPHAPQSRSLIEEERMVTVEEEAGIIDENGAVERMTAVAEVTLPPASIDTTTRVAKDKISKKKESKKKLTKEECVDFIKLVLQKWNWSEGFPTIHDVCPQPINRFHISLTFYNLLDFQKQEFVILVENQETMELEYIKKGK